MTDISKEAEKAYNKAFNSGHTEELQKIACKVPVYAHWYAKDIRWADIEYCQEWACKDPKWAYWFAKDVVGEGLDVCLEAVKGTEWEDAVRKLVIERGVG